MSADAPRPRYASVVFDADSTLADIEGIDWLAEQRTPDVAAAIVALTNRAMNGEVALDAVYAERIARIRPTAEELEQLGAAYVARAINGARALIAELHAAGVRTAIVSGGIRQALLPLAAHLGIPVSHVFAVTLRASTEHAGSDTESHANAASQPSPHALVFDSLDGPQPLATQNGKITVVRELIANGTLPTPVALTGDGATDAAARGEVSAFIAFTQVARRPVVVATAPAEAASMAELRTLLFV